MSDSRLARRTEAQVYFAGVDISAAVNEDLISLSFTDNEEDAADDLQIKVSDRDGKWLCKWLNSMVNEAASGGEIISTPEAANMAGSDNSKGGTSNGGGSISNGTSYKVTANGGVNVRSNASESGKLLGKLAYGTIVTVNKFSGEWANITYSGKSAYIKGNNLKVLGSGGGSSTSSTAAQAYSSGSGSASTGGGSWAIGDEVIANGRPQYSSYGLGKPGFMVTDHKGKITHLNLKSGIPYPIHVDYLGWFAENQVRKVGGEEPKQEEKPASVGLKISASIVRKNWNGDGKDDVLDLGQFELDSVNAKGPPSTVTIKGTALPYSSAIRQTEKSKSWESVTLKDIAGTIAGSGGMALMYESDNNPSFERVEQYRMSDIAFLQKLCHDAGASLKVSNNIIVIFDQAKYESRKAVKTISRGESGGYKDYSLSTVTNGSYSSCRVSYTDSSGNVIASTEYAEGYNADNKGNQQLEVSQKVGSVAEAQALAHKILRLHNKFEYEASFTFPGDPSLAAGLTVMLSGFGAWDGKYLIKQTKHSLSRSGFTTQINLRKVLEMSVSSGDNQQEEKGDSDEEIDRLAWECIRGDWDNDPKRKERLIAAGHDRDKVQDRVNEILYGKK